MAGVGLWFASPVMWLVDKLHARTGSLPLTLLLLACGVHLAEVVLVCCSPMFWFERKKKREEAALEKLRSTTQPIEYLRRKTEQAMHKAAPWQTGATVWVSVLSALIKAYCVLAIYAGVVTSTTLRGQPFLWTPDVTSRDPRHLVPLVLLVLPVLAWLMGKVRGVRMPTGSVRLRGAWLVLIVGTELIPLAVTVYLLCRMVVKVVQPYLLMLVAGVVLSPVTVLRRLFR